VKSELERPTKVNGQAGLYRIVHVMANKPDASNMGRFLFRLRSFTPIPLILVLIFYSDPTPLPGTVGCLFMILGECLRLWAVGYAGGSTRTRTLDAARDFVTTGPYAHVRNPLYLGNLLLSVGVCFIAHVYWMIIILVIAYFIQYMPIILCEESHLLETCGTPYRAYYAAVPRFLPHLRPYVASSKHDFSLLRALASEKRTLTAIVCIVVLILGRSLLP